MDPDSTWAVLDTTATALPEYLHTGLDPGSTRHYRVSAINSVGKSPASNVASETTPADPPGAPTHLMATANGPTQIDLSWRAPVDDGGADITAYRIWFSVNNGQTWSLLTGSTGSAATTWSDMRGLEPATTRHYRVAAINRAGISPYSDTASATTDAVPPGPPTELTATADGISRIDLKWKPPANSGGVPLTGYQIEVSSDGGSQWEILEDDTESPKTEFTHTGLDPASTRHYRVSGINAADLVGDPSNVDSATTDATVPDAPTDLVATKDGTSRIDLEWNAPDYDGGAEITGYRIEVSRDRGLVWRDLVEDTESTATTFPHEGLAPATTRFYRVSAINRVGAGEPSNEANATTDATVPNAPLRLTATAEDHSQIDLDWDIPDFDGGTPITGYRIEVSDNEGATWKALVLDTESLTTAYSHTGLEPATTRHYRVSAINEIGIGEPSNEANATTDAIAPDPPTNLMATASEPTRIDLTWSAPAYDGGAPVTGYRIEVSADGATWADLQRNTGSVRTSYAHVGLEPGSTRHYRVSAINIAGTGEPSNTASATTDDPVERAGRVNAAILPHFAAAATTSTFSAISARIESVASRNPLRSQLNAAGLLSRAGGMGMRGSADGLNMARLFDGASFAMPWGGGPQEQDTGTPIGFTTWGGAEFTSMGEPGGDRIEWEGDMLSIHLGADARVHRDILAGVAGSRSSGSYDFTDVTGAEREVAGTYDAMMTSLNPYVAWLPGRTGVSIWAAGSFGWGEVTVDDEPGGERMSDTRSRAGAVGGSRIMMTRGASALRMRAEGWMSRVEVDGSEGMDSLTLDMRRMRVALEWSQVQALPGGREVNLLVEGGLRYDDGDGSDGAGMEVGGGVRFTSGTRALTVEGHGRLLATSPTDYEEWGFRGMIQVNPQAVLSGLSLRIVPAWGQSASGLQELYERGISDRPDMSHSLQRGRVNTRVEYGLGEFNGTPYGRFYIADGGARAFGTGMRYELSRVLDLRVEGTRTEGASGPARHGLAMRGRWVF
ncbi:MAG: fibronectin type III domain-containing protein [Gemmatimonadetes bacterium]|nr:fibronectin type III domain-containing protein [Gemmatimonadota bacterium]